MGKRRALAMAAGNSPASEVSGSITDLDVFRKTLKGAVATALDNKHVGFTDPERIAGNRVLSSLTGPGATTATAKYQYGVVPFYYLTHTTYWLAVTIAFAYREGEAHLDEVSVLVFSGDAQDPNKVPLLRAEWTHSDEPSTVVHAQPHWHVYSSSLNRGAIIQDGDFLDMITVEEFDEPAKDAHQNSHPAWDGVELFHFAMASRWHEIEEGSIYVQMTGNNLRGWLQGCIAYTRSQIEYLHNKSS